MIGFVKEEKKAVRFEVKMKGDVQAYALNWLNICNNIRDHKELLKCYNNSGSTVFVVCEKDAAEFCKDWLGWFGAVSEPEEVLCIVPALQDNALTDTEYQLLCDAEFLPVDSSWI